MVLTCIWWWEVQVVLWLWEGTPQQAAYNGQWSIAMHQEGGGGCYYCLLLSKGLKFSSAQCINSTEGRRREDNVKGCTMHIAVAQCQTAHTPLALPCPIVPLPCRNYIWSQTRLRLPRCWRACWRNVDGITSSDFCFSRLLVLQMHWGWCLGLPASAPQKLPLWGNITASSVFICNSFRLLILKTILKFTVIGNLIPLQALQAPRPWRLGVLQSKCLTNFLPQSLGKFENVCTKFERTFCPAFTSRELLLITSTLTAASVCGRKRPRIT